MDDELRAIETEAKGVLDELKALAEDKDKLSFPAGISLLGLKSHVLLAYIHHLCILTARRLDGESFVPPNASEEDEEVGEREGSGGQEGGMKATVEELVWNRLAMERIRPMQVKLKHQIDKLVRKAEQADERGGQLDDEEIINDPLSFKPNLQAFLRPKPSTDEQSKNEGGIYRPPRLTAMSYPDPRTADPDVNPHRSRPHHAPVAVRDHAAHSTSAPHYESTSGLGGGAPSQSVSSRAKALQRMEQFEEDNMMRIFGSKKERRKRRVDEQDVALGGQGVSARVGKGGRRLGGLEGEFVDLLGADNRRKGKVRASAQDEDRGPGKDPYAPLREQGRVKKKARFEDDGPRRDGDKRRHANKFERAVKRSNR